MPTTKELIEIVEKIAGVWVKASERLPQNEGDLIFIKFGINHQFCAAAFFEGGLWYDSDGNGLFDSPVNIVWQEPFSPETRTALLKLLQVREEEEKSDEEAANLIMLATGNHHDRETFLSGRKRVRSQQSPAISGESDQEAYKEWLIWWNEFNELAPPFKIFSKARQSLTQLQTEKEELQASLKQLESKIEEAYRLGRGEKEERDALMGEMVLALECCLDDSRELESQNRWLDGTTSKNQRNYDMIKENIKKAEYLLTRYNSLKEKGE